MPALRARPLLPPRLRELEASFGFLSFSRTIGFGVVGAIPLVEIAAYHALFPTAWPLGDFVELIRLIDARYLKIINQPKSKTDGPGPHPRSRD